MARQATTLAYFTQNSPWHCGPGVGAWVSRAARALLGSAVTARAPHTQQSDQRVAHRARLSRGEQRQHRRAPQACPRGTRGSRLSRAYQPRRPRCRSALSRAGWPTPGKPSRKTDALVLSAFARVSRGGEPMARIARSGQVRDLHHAGALDRPTSARDRDDFGIAGSQDRGQGKDG